MPHRSSFVLSWTSFKTKKELIISLRAEDKQPQITCLVFVPEIGKIAPKRESTLLSWGLCEAGSWPRARVLPLSLGAVGSRDSPASLHSPWFLKASLFMLQLDCSPRIPASGSGRSPARRAPAGNSPGRSAEGPSGKQRGARGPGPAAAAVWGDLL